MIAIDERHASPNHGERVGGATPGLLVLHYTGMPTAEGALAWLCDPRAEVSCHYFIHEDGRICRLVPEERRAWHAGRSFWRGITDVNSHSIGVEIVNPGHEFGYRSFPDVQVEAVVRLCRDVLARWPIAPRDVVAHSDIAPARKEDPGELFPWDRLAAAGVGHFVPPAPLREGPALGIGDDGPAVDALRRQFAAYGYGVSEAGPYDDALATVVRAFQRHFRPERVDGRADLSTRDTLDRLLAALPAG